MAERPRPWAWLLKTEPDTFSIDDLKRKGKAPWDGVRNFSARNRLREMVVGELALVYHSSTKPTAVVGIARVCREAYPDPSQHDPKSEYYDGKSDPANPRWSMVDMEYVAHFPRPVTLEEIKQEPGLKEMVLVKRPRLSVQEVTSAELERVVAMGGGVLPEVGARAKAAADKPKPAKAPEAAALATKPTTAKTKRPAKKPATAKKAAKGQR
jgi:predicted RNA-binding protein with PUA-like domain